MLKYVYNRQRHSVAEIERIILLRISRGVYSARGRIPNREQLAMELGANKSTLSNVYQTLAQRGFLDTRGGRGTFVTEQPSSVLRKMATTELGQSLEQVIRSIIADRPARGQAPLTDGCRHRTHRPEQRRPDRLHRLQYAGRGHAGQAVPARDSLSGRAAAGRRAGEPRILLGQLRDHSDRPSHLTELEAGLPNDGPQDSAEMAPIFTRPSAESQTRIACLKPGSHSAMDGYVPTAGNRRESL